MQNLINQAPVKRNYTFIDNIRCIAMMSIVADHSFGVGDDHFPTYSAGFWTYIFNIQLAKFGTVSFFLLAGFLLGDKFTEYTPAQYLGRRFKNTFRPWIIWSLLFVAIIIITTAVNDIKFNGDPFIFSESLLKSLTVVYLYSNYWFIINFLVCIAILLAFKKNLYSWKLGGALLACTLFYSVNVYYEWILPLHTTALFGFVFFLWLGAQLNQNWDAIDRRIKATPYWVFILIFVFTLVLSMAEVRLLYERKSADPINTLRISNLLYSLAAFGLFVKIRDFNLINYIKPRETTFGIYLIHYILIYSLLPEILRHFGLPKVYNMPVWGIFVYQYSRFLTTYIITFLLVKGINATSFKWLIGNTATTAKANS